MRKITSWLLVVAVLASLLCVPVLADSADGYVTVETETTYIPKTLTLELLAAEDTTNGRLSVSYDPAQLTLVEAEVKGAVTDILEEDGQVTLGYADLEAFAAGETLAVLQFDVGAAVSSALLTVLVEDFNQNENLDAASEVRVRFSTGSGSGSAGREDEDEDDGLPFTDVKESDWFYDAVKYVVDKGYFKGVTDTTFNPNGVMTRAMFVTVLGRMAGAEVDHDTDAGFSDVKPGSYYAGYVAWASENGIVMGTSDTTFSPNANVTREQMAAFLYRYAKFAGLDVTASDETMNTFSDAASVSSWAEEAMAWATDRGILNGTGKGLEPQASATRAQVAQIILNFQTKG